MNQTLKDIFKLVIFLFPIMLIIALTNYFIDPGNIYKTRSFEDGIVATLLSGRNAAFPLSMSQIDEVKILRSMTTHLMKDPDLIVLGSSRSLPLNNGMIKVNGFYNASMTSASIGDLVAIYNILEKKEIHPKILLISIDPDLFVLNPWPRDDFTKDFTDLLNRLGMKISFKIKSLIQYKIIRSHLENFLELFSPAYFQDSIKFLMAKNYDTKAEFNNRKIQKRDIRKVSYWATYDKHAKGGVIFPDASREFGNEQINCKGQVKSNIIKANIQEMPRIKTKAHLILPNSKNLFEAFVFYLQRNKIKLVFLLVPEHSLTYKYEYDLFGNQSAPIIVEDYIRGFAAKNHIRVWGSYNLQNTNFTDNDMIDHHHPNRGSMYKLFLPLGSVPKIESK